MHCAAVLLLLCVVQVRADSTIEPGSELAWGGNIGDLNWRPSSADGVLTGEYVCSGLVWAANAGWINLGSGLPANRIRYQNDDGRDFGVNLLADGSLRGLAWGANIGWVAFEDVGNPRIDFASGVLLGKLWGANIGWINLEAGEQRSVATSTIPGGSDGDGDGIPDAWELDRASDTVTLTLGGDVDADGISDQDEYLADSNPLDASEAGVRITSFTLQASSATIRLEWTSRRSRSYRIEVSDDLAAGLWSEGALGTVLADSDSRTAREFTMPTSARQFYRIRAFRPLSL